MKKRLRKKKHLREFKEFGFDLNLKTKELKEAEYCNLFDDIALYIIYVSFFSMI